MSYVAPNVLTFKTRYPEFDSVDSGLVTLVLDEAISEVGENWLEKDRARAQMLLTAHILILEGEPERSVTGKVGAKDGDVIQRSVGPVYEMYSARSNGSNDTPTKFVGKLTKEFLRTSYGVDFLKLMRRNIGSVLVA